MFSLILKKDDAHDDSIYCCAWNKRANIKHFLVTAGLDTNIKLWNINNNRLQMVHNFTDHSMGVISVALSPDGYTLASSALDSIMFIWDVEMGVKVHEVEAGLEDVWEVAFSPNGRQVISGSHTGKINIYSVESGKQERVLNTRGAFTTSVAWSPDGKYIAGGSVDGSVNIFDVAQGKLLNRIDSHSSTIRSICYSPNSQQILAGSITGEMNLYNVTSGSQIGKTFGTDSFLFSANFSPNGKHIVSGCGDNSVIVWKVDGQQRLLEHKKAVCGVTFDPTSCMIASVSKDRSINIYKHMSHIK